MTHENNPKPNIPKEKERLGLFEKFSNLVTRLTGSTGSFIFAFMLVVVWAATGPIFHYSENWQLVINTGTTIITFLMVFLIQKSQNKDSLAIQLKLNELIAAHEFASNRMVDIENIPEADLKVIQKYYSQLSEITKNEVAIKQTHSIDEAEEMHELKRNTENEIRQHFERGEQAMS